MYIQKLIYSYVYRCRYTFFFKSHSIIVHKELCKNISANKFGILLNLFITSNICGLYIVNCSGCPLLLRY